MDFLPGYRSLIPEALKALSALSAGSIAADQNQFMPQQNMQMLDQAAQQRQLMPKPSPGLDTEFLASILSRPQPPSVTINTTTSPMPSGPVGGGYMPTPSPMPTPSRPSQPGPAVDDRPQTAPVYTGGSTTVQSGTVPIIWTPGATQNKTGQR